MYMSPTADKIITQILSTILRMWRDKKVMILDIKADNVGKDEAGNYVLFDFGVSDSPSVRHPVI